ncbi:MAG TPA: TRAP transporter TatT component family protein [Vicinamibacterales bacterium]|nr:TRAP transporter TatT component family protein [Vicinamibacterales bacterium]
MMSCILVFYLAIFGILPQAPGPDALYAQRDQIASARQAAAIWDQRLKTNGGDFEAAWKLARAHYWLGGHAPEAERKQFLESGVEAGRTAAAIEPRKPEGHFWMAANMGALAESFGLRQGLKYRGAIRDALTTVLSLDPAFQQGSADRALGRWYYKVPSLFGGSKTRSEEHLRKSLTYNANSISSRFFLAETLLEMDRKAEAIAQLERVIETAPDPAWIPEDREFKQKAEQLLARHKR